MRAALIDASSRLFFVRLSGMQRGSNHLSMASILPDRKYTKDHEWAQMNGKTVLMGITDFAQSSLGDVTFVQLPEAGKTFNKGDIIGTVESVKAVSDIYAPISGKITRLNADVVNDPSLLNQDPYGKAWLLEMEASNENEFQDLLAPDAYGQHAL